MTTKTTDATIGFFFFMSCAGCAFMAAVTGFDLGWMLAGSVSGCVGAFAVLTALD